MRHAAKLLLLAAAGTLVLGAGCKKPKKFMRTKHQQELVDNSILASLPAPKYAVDANLEDRVKLIGVDVEPEKIQPGGKAIIHFYWEVLDELGDEGDWMVFVHIEGPVAGGGVARVIADHYAVEDGEGGAGLYPPREWKKGQIIKDTKTVTLKDPKGKALGPGEVVIYTGLFDMEAYRSRQEDIRLKIRNENKVKSSAGRVEAARFMVGNAPPAAPARPFRAPDLQVRKAIGPITVDGQLDEAAWRAAVTTGAFRRPDGATLPADMLTQAKLLWDESALYVGFIVRDDKLESTYTQRDEELWKGDVVEVYLDPGSDTKDYIELQVSPNNVVFDALFAERRTPDWKDACKWNMTGLRTAVHKGPLPGRAAGPNLGWTVEIRIPWTDIAGTNGAEPAPKSRWRANFFRIDHPGSFGRLASWSAVSDDNRPDFHNLERGGDIVFVETPPMVRDRVLKAPPATGEVPSPPAPVVAPPAGQPALPVPAVQPVAPAPAPAPEAEANPAPTPVPAAEVKPVPAPAPAPAAPAEPTPKP